MKVTYQTSDHGAGKFSVQVFDEFNNLIADRNIVRDIDGYRVVMIGSHGMTSERPQHATPADAAKWYASLVADAERPVG